MLDDDLGEPATLNPVVTLDSLTTADSWGSVPGAKTFVLCSGARN